MQKELDQDYPELEIQFLAVNPFGSEVGIPAFTDGRDVPVLQELNEFDDVAAAWGAGFRDLIILDASNEKADVFPILTKPVTTPENYDELRQILIDLARDEQCLAGDANRDGLFNSDDLVSLFIAGEYEDGITGNSTWDTGDFNHDKEFDSGDLVLALQCGKYETVLPDAAAVGAALSGTDRRVDDVLEDQAPERWKLIDVLPPAHARLSSSCSSVMSCLATGMIRWTGTRWIRRLRMKGSWVWF